MQRFYSGDIVVHIEWDPNARADRYGKPAFKGFITGPTNAGRIDRCNPRWRWDFSELYGWDTLKGMAETAISFAMHQEEGKDAPGWMASEYIAEEVNRGVVYDENGDAIAHSNYRYRWFVDGKDVTKD